MDFYSENDESDNEAGMNKCKFCCKTFAKKFNLDRHIKKCNKKDEEENVEVTKHRCIYCEKASTRKWNKDRHELECNQYEALEIEMLKETEDYNKKYLKGKMIFEILNKNNNVKEEALDTEKKAALEIYIKHSSLNMSDNVELLSWQSQLMECFAKPTDRQVIWVIGEKGGEGKTFFQKLVLKMFGTRRVMCMDLNAKSKNINYILATQTLTCKDIFLFNISRNVNTNADFAYNSIEGIKDGAITSEKYFSKTIKLKTPNTVMVFSNSRPDYKQLSTDRWIIYQIKNDILNEMRTV